MTASSNSLFETVMDHGERITNLEEADKKHDDRLKLLEDRSIKLENTVMVENRETRQTIVEQNSKLFTLVEGAMTIQTTRNTQTHELRMAKWNHISNILLKLGGGITGLLASGTGVYMLIEHFLKK
ncbi:hypothetical protein [Psychrobacillus vulpis]|uniref:Uncharacterized protein n=1 Tax=Psychrobacillus vulpis TaxID=2325572 RepID=A0A544TWG0_9BACI|nr:hypothetical protein [Psychrobacillus vulpis]TQR21783.1 hypothetical protein FG384_02220 [Psychrobacillus vulpis]